MSKVAKVKSKRDLPAKETALFKELLTLYETRQLKKGQKTADQILKKFPEHGETLAMKGLVLTHMGKRDEGLELVKQGVRLDLTSHICWHVFGLLHKGEKNYEEAVKSYTQALRFDSENLNMLRDLAQLQTHLRMYEALIETRHTMLKIRPSLRGNWVALAVAYHLNGNLTETRKILEHYERTLKNIPDYDVEHSELLLYHVKVLEELDDITEALYMLDINAKSRSIVDKTAIMEIRARLLSKLRAEEAEHAWRILVEHNPDNYEYYKGYLANQGAADDPARTLAILQDFSEKLPHARAPRRIALDVASNPEFTQLAKPYILSSLEKGIPSLFSDIKSLYKDIAKREAIQSIVEAAKQEHASGASSSSTSLDPTTYLWTLYFLAQHYSKLSQFSRALEILDEALTHTPTLPELYTCKARLLKRSGDLLGSVRCMNEARLLDGQDRFLNTKCAKYHLRAGLIEEANAIFGLFTKKDAPSPGSDLEDMQSLLYLTELADAYTRLGKPNLALKKYSAIQKVFNEIDDDQYDFHGYSLRKFTINMYLGLVKWEAQLRSHPAYVHAALSSSEIFVQVHDNPLLGKITAPTNAQLTDAEKKAKKKAKKAAQKANDEKKPANQDKDADYVAITKDDDPDGTKLLGSSDPLEHAAKFLAPLSNLSRNDINAWIGIYDVSVRRSKLLQAVRALNHARSLDPEHPELHIRLADLRQRSSAPTIPPADVVFKESLSQLLPDELSLETFNSTYLQRHSGLASAILAAAKVAHKLNAPLSDVEEILFTSLGDHVDITIKTALDALSFLRSLNSQRLEEYRELCDTRFVLSTIFKSVEALNKLRVEVLAVGTNGSSSSPGVGQDIDVAS